MCDSQRNTTTAITTEIPCTQCKRPIKTGEAFTQLREDDVSWMGGIAHPKRAYCLECKPPRPRMDSAHCAHCGRPIYAYLRFMQKAYCDWACERLYWLGYWREARRMKAVTHYLNCAQCGEPFTAKRKDARYCSAKCRQRARREAQR